MGPDLWARLERAARRPIAPGVLHPDACENVALHGVAWAIPPARATVRCVLRGGKVRWDPPRPSVPAGAEALLAVLPLRPARPCPRCGQPLADRLDPRDLSAADAALSAAAALAAELLRRQYVLTDEQLSGLLSFAAGEVPAWLATMAHWAARATGRPVRLTADRPGESRARPRLWRRMLHRGL